MTRRDFTEHFKFQTVDGRWREITVTRHLFDGGTGHFVELGCSTRIQKRPAPEGAGR
jgi:hypothetical protein